MALMATQVISLAGITPAYAAVSASDTFRPGDHTFLHVKNGGGTPDSVVIADTTSPAPLGATAFTPSVTVSVPNAGEKMMGPFPQSRFAGASGVATVTHSFLTTVTAGVFTT